MSEDKPEDLGTVRTVEKDMSISHQDFFRILPGALATRGYRRDGDTVVAEEGDGRRMEIILSPERTRDVPDLPLPQTHVRLLFSGYAEAEVEERLALFDRSYQRGGG